MNTSVSKTGSKAKDTNRTGTGKKFGNGQAESSFLTYFISPQQEDEIEEIDVDEATKGVNGDNNNDKNDDNAG